MSFESSHEQKIHILRTFRTHLVVHIHQKEKIALEIAANSAIVNEPLGNSVAKFHH